MRRMPQPTYWPTLQKEQNNKILCLPTKKPYKKTKYRSHAKNMQSYTCEDEMLFEFELELKSSCLEIQMK